jgi:hypothetical protein
MQQPKIQRMNMCRIAGRRESLKEIIAAYSASSRIHSGKWHFQTCARVRLKWGDKLVVGLLFGKRRRAAALQNLEETFSLHNSRKRPGLWRPSAALLRAIHVFCGRNLNER